VITADYTGKFTEPSKLGGTHGYFPPDRPEIALVSDFSYGPLPSAPAKSPNARMIDIAPHDPAHWLGLDLQNAQGLRPRSSLFRRKNRSKTRKSCQAGY